MKKCGIPVTNTGYKLNIYIKKVIADILVLITSLFFSKIIYVILVYFKFILEKEFVCYENKQNKTNWNKLKNRQFWKK